MRCIVKYVTRKSRGGTAVKEQPVEAEALMAGRGNDCGIHLPDPRVLLHHAEFSLRGGEVYLAPQLGADVSVNGNLTQMTRIKAGDKIELGPYELTLEENDHAGTIAIAVEMTKPLGDDLQRVMEQSEIRTGRISVRTISWALALIVAVAFFAAPWIASFFHQAPGLRMVLNTRDRAVASAPTEMWSSGGISSAHKFFGDSCETCHVKAFIPVADETCLTCHEAVEHHADPKRFVFASFEDHSCQSCHKEHQGDQAIMQSDQAFCADCHVNLPERAPKSDLREASDFGTNHPQFRPTVVIDAALHKVERRLTMSDDPPPREDSALRFPHNRHLRPSGVRDPVRGNVVLGCADCHVADASGNYMQPISFDKNCHRCHTLKFDIYVPDRELVHGDPQSMFKQIRDIYDAVAMRGGYEEKEAPPLIRRRPGQKLTPDEKKQALDWSAAKTADLLNGRFGRGLCENCHETFDLNASDETAGANWGVEPVSASNVWFPKARYTHASHRDMECGSCHAARNSVEAAEVLMPNIGTCRACHGGEHATDKVPSTCMSCHVFHRPELEPMRKTKAKDTAAAPEIFGRETKAASAAPPFMPTMLAAFHGAERALK